MKHYTNKETNEVFGYESLEDAKKFNDDFENLVEMSDELFQELREQPLNHTWTLQGWVLDEEAHNLYLKQIEADKELEVIGSLEFRLSEIKQDIIYNSVMGYDNSALTVEAREIEMMLEELNKGDYYG